MTAYDDFAARYHGHFSRDANQCMILGIDARRGDLPDRSAAERSATVTEARELIAAASELSAGELDFDQRLDVDMARLSLEREAHDLTYTFNGATMAEQRPRAGADVGEGLTVLLSNDPRPATERLADATARVESVPDYVEGALSALTTPLARWVAVDLDAVSGLPGLFETLERWADDVSFADAPRLRTAREQAEAALRDYSRRLSALPTTQQLHIGTEEARRLVALRGIDASLEDLHRMATDFLAEISTTVEELRARLAPKYGLPVDASADDLQDHLAERFRVPMPNGELGDVLDRYQLEREKLIAFIREHDLFPLPPAQDMIIERTPAFLTPVIPAGAMWCPPPFRPGTRTSLIHLTLSQELLPEHTELSIPGMMMHEGIPGHHLQLAWAAEHPSIIRRHYSGNEHHEGWTTYLEDYMLDVGYMGDLTDEARFVGKRDIARVGARVAIDLFFMTGDKGFLEVGVPCDLSSDDPFVAAANLLAAVTGFVPGRVQGELNWYSAERGYPLSYLTGNRMTWALKRRVTDANRGRLDGLALDRAFHDVFLRSGNMPLAWMDRVMARAGLLGGD